MVMKAEPLVAAIEAARARRQGARVVLLDPRGRRLDQQVVRELHGRRSLVLVCGRYEGVDERVRRFVDEELSLGDFILTGGELAALTVVDAVSRLEPGVLGNEASPGNESFEEGLLEFPQLHEAARVSGRQGPRSVAVGRPRQGRAVARAMSLRTTRDRRPDLFAKRALSDEDARLLEGLE
jgi:tRNA (guanine37-N1)-methyltransferase